MTPEALESLLKRPNKALRAELKAALPRAHATFVISLGKFLKILRMSSFESLKSKILGGVWVTLGGSRARFNVQIKLPDLKEINQLIMKRASPAVK